MPLAIRVPDKIASGDFTDLPTPGYDQDFKAPVWDDAASAFRWVTRTEWDTLIAGTTNRVLFDSLVLWWDMNESSGSRIDLVSATIATDSGGVTRVAGPSAKLLYAAQFASTGSKHLAVADNADTRLPTSGPVTYLCWFYVALAAGVNGDIIGKGAYDLLFDHIGAPSFRLIIANQTVTYASVVPATATWYMASFGIGDDGKAFLQINNGTEEKSSGTVTRTNTATPLYFGRSVNNRYTNNRMAAFGKWNRYLSQSERDILWNSGTGLAYPFDTSTPATVDIISPVAYQVTQSSGSSGTIPITAAVRHAAANVNASFAGGANQQIAASQKGIFTANLTGQGNGQGTLQLSTPKRSASQSLVGLGDIFIIAGQSNASGRVTNTKSYSHATLKSILYGNDYTWKEMADFTDSNSGQVDSVSSDSGTYGSFWPLVATSYLAARSAPCAFVPCAKGGTTSTQWLPGANHQDRTTLYGSMVYRTLQTGAKCILWWQGEQDAYNGVSAATYQSNLATIVAALATDLPGVKFMPCKLQLGNTYSDGNAAQIQTAIANIWAGGYSNVVTGPDFSAMRADGGDHFTTDNSANTVASMWWTAIRTAFGW